MDEMIGKRHVKVKKRMCTEWLYALNHMYKSIHQPNPLSMWHPLSPHNGQLSGKIPLGCPHCTGGIGLKTIHFEE